MKRKAVLIGSVLTSLASIIGGTTAVAFSYYSVGMPQAHSKKSNQTSPSSTDSNEASVTIAVTGMTCGSCAVQIESTLAKTRGVNSSDVSYEKGQAVVRYDPNATSVKAIRSVIESLGYRAADTKDTHGEAQVSFATANTLSDLPVSKLKEEFNRAGDKVRGDPLANVRRVPAWPRRGC